MAPKAIGYARTSTARQTGGIEVQVLALKEAGCTVVFQEQVSTRLKEKDRPQLQSALTSLEEGDELVVLLRKSGSGFTAAPGVSGAQGNKRASDPGANLAAGSKVSTLIYALSA